MKVLIFRRFRNLYKNVITMGKCDLMNLNDIWNFSLDIVHRKTNSFTSGFIKGEFSLFTISVHSVHWTYMILYLLYQLCIGSTEDAMPAHCLGDEKICLPVLSAKPRPDNW